MWFKKKKDFVTLLEYLLEHSSGETGIVPRWKDLITLKCTNIIEFEFNWLYRFNIFSSKVQ